MTTRLVAIFRVFGYFMMCRLVLLWKKESSIIFQSADNHSVYFSINTRATRPQEGPSTESMTA